VWGVGITRKSKGVTGKGKIKGKQDTKSRYGVDGKTTGLRTKPKKITLKAEGRFHQKKRKDPHHGGEVEARRGINNIGKGEKFVTKGAKPKNSFPPNHKQEKGGELHYFCRA